MREAIQFTFIALGIIAIITCTAIWPVYGFSILGITIFAIGIYDLFQKKHAILRNFPVLGHMRFLLEMIGPELHQYFVESDTDGKPIDRNHRTYIYERAKLEKETHPFGTELNVEAENAKWMKHSIYPSPLKEEAPRVLIGGPDCKQPYSASIFNISAMSFGALSKNAVMALNLGAKAGNFFHDTGEGGISDYHLKGGDLVYEVGTGYFGCRNEDGHFSPEIFKEKAAYPTVKMIEIKISQGAKPGHGGVLPAVKNDEEIAKIRGIKPHTDVISPPGHSAFSDAEGLLRFVKQMRELSNGKPIGFKLCIGSKQEFIDICEKMVETGIKPDFITVDGSEGGTGAAPIDFSNYVGMPWEKALVFVVDTLNGYGLKKDIKIVTATKIFTAFDIFKALSIGADVCNSARGMMIALGCIQALRCDTNKCPTGVTTNNPTLMRGLVVEEKWQRVRNYHARTVKEFLELFAAAGCNNLSDLNRSYIFKQIATDIKCYDEIYPIISEGQFLENANL
ncbi:glutamate synthase family protein [Aequorivita sublithincola DSM 14238]|uniref:Glutamate synthase family protein n=1 Tax=Aequorivita sublithincola (strain DSM 14238 / LMG 21431 / ACAM 643 / 9-3) TaxID=746697 RepID=I3YRD6_AEQSU|nr:FMN-binding glutamate synthase family protein [Aequorivita sublithincola]AFL79554.1 glutamate synthase family protein [Aequorivita sublithincola DSM 14238]